MKRFLINLFPKCKPQDTLFFFVFFCMYCEEIKDKYCLYFGLEFWKYRQVLVFCCLSTRHIKINQNFLIIWPDYLTLLISKWYLNFMEQSSWNMKWQASLQRKHLLSLSKKLKITLLTKYKSHFGLLLHVNVKGNCNKCAFTCLLYFFKSEL